LANQGKIEDAQTTLDMVSVAGAPLSTDVCRDATQGFIAFRSGDYLRGRENYEQAIKKAAGNNLVEFQIRAAIHFAREELSVDRNKAAQILEKVLGIARPSRDPDIAGVLQRLLLALQGQRDTEGKLDKIVSTVGELLKGSKPPLIIRPDLKLS